MISFSSITQTLRRLGHLRDPQVQVWWLAGLALMLLGMGHLRAESGLGEGKIQGGSAVGRLLLAGASVEWSENFGSQQPSAQRPALCLKRRVKAAGLGSSKAVALMGLKVRPAMMVASSRPWMAVTRELREKLASAVVAGDRKSVV